MAVELLSPAGSYEAFLEALYNGADAIYLATERFGARAYAKNLTKDELKKALLLAHSLNKKIYVTVNTILKEDELDDAKEYIKELYLLGVDGLILADFALIPYVIRNFPLMEAHISTQCGVKNIDDIHFFKSIGAKRTVVARENSLDEIKEFKKNSNMPLEVFAYGALCVSYSGGCLMSSMLSKRSGNRGRCSQNCRREYQIYKDGKPLGPKGFYLSMKDLNTSSYLKELKDANIDSLKLEGRMKSKEYVKVITSDFRKKLDDDSFQPKHLDTVFHRMYTKGFLFNEDKGTIVEQTKRTNEGAYIGNISKKEKGLTKIILKRPLSLNDRIRIEGENDYYFTIDKIYDKNFKEIKEAKDLCYLNIFKDQKEGQKIYKMVDSTIDTTITNEYKMPLDIKVSGKVGLPLTLSLTLYDNLFKVESDNLLEESKSRPLDYDTLYKQLSKLNDTSYYLNHLELNIDNNLFMTVSQINELRRKLIEALYEFKNPERKIEGIKKETIKLEDPSDEIIITASCKTEAQRKALEEAGIKVIYTLDNTYSYFLHQPKEDIKSDTILVGNYGGLYRYKDKYVVCDTTFNAINSEAVHNLLVNGANVVTLSLEMDMNLIRSLVKNYKEKYNQKPNIEMVVYSHINLMTLKYCPLRRFGECKDCMNHNYQLKDELSSFIISHKNCVTQILNEKALNLIDELKEITKEVKRIRLDFTIESYEETKQIIELYKEKLSNLDQKSNYFNPKTNTRAYYKNKIL